MAALIVVIHVFRINFQLINLIHLCLKVKGASYDQVYPTYIRKNMVTVIV